MVHEQLVTHFYKEHEFNDSKIGRVPKEWEVAKLREIVILLRNGLTVRQDNENQGYPITRIETISYEKVDASKVGYVNKIPKELVKEYKLLDGDILFSHINSLIHIGKTALYEGYPEALLHGMNLLLLRPDKNKVDPQFLLYLFKLYKRKAIFKSMAKKAVNQASINQTELGKLKVVLPNLMEQQKIAPILSTVDKAIEITDEIIAKTEKLKQGLMQKLFTEGIGHKEFNDTEIGRIPKDWDVARLGKLMKDGLIKHQKGRAPRVILKHPDNDTLPYLNAESLRTGTFSQWAKFTNELVKVRKDNILMIWDGFYCGYCFIGYDGLLSSTMIKIDTDENNLNSHFLFHVLKTHFKELNTKIAGMYLKHVNKNVFESLKLPIPRLDEQKRIAKTLDVVDDKLELEGNEKSKLESAKKALMDLLLTGKIRVKV